MKGDTSDHDINPAKDIWAAGFGFTGMPTMLPVMYTERVMKCRITLRRLVEVCCTKLPKVSGIYPQNGEIRIGSEADLVIVDTEITRTCRAKDLLPSCDFTVFEGGELTGWPVMTLLRGQVIFRDGKITAKHGVGRFLRRTKKEGR